ncbi:CinA family protein [Hyphomicrobium sp. CS1BSMeth3]|uniref:CinA family protein n=1 Tax=Hyphomicrobium sp. CS1BSMeth3 TaxID=1892844 RepID=UPI000931115C|nr:CinA family protein [Hyphomicrobium sp. CS1BSMeth3]
MFDENLIRTAEALLATLRARKLMLATAESCTGGLIAGVLTEIAGSSDVVERGFITYSNEAKIELIDVPAEMIAAHGAVSKEVALAMAAGALAHSRADIAVAVTGVAGPGGGSAAKPVGLVHLAAQRRGLPPIHRKCRFGEIGRRGIRMATVAVAFEMVDELVRV